MSEKHPIIAITGSSGAGTTSVTRTFERATRTRFASASERTFSTVTGWAATHALPVRARVPKSNVHDPEG